MSVGVSFATSSLAQSGGQATLILKVIGLRSEKGQVKIAVFNSSEKWLGEQPIYSSTINVDSQTVTWTINDVPYGDYVSRYFTMKTAMARWVKMFWVYLYSDMYFPKM